MITKNLNVYFTVCILFRLLIAYSGYLVLNNLKKYKYQYYFLIIITFIIGASFFYQYVKNDRKVGAFNQKVWWENYRIIHSGLYLLFTYLLINKVKHSYIVIVFDTFLGGILYLKQHYF